MSDNQVMSYDLVVIGAGPGAADLLTLRAAWRSDSGSATDEEIAMAKVYSSEMCQYVTDEAIQILGGMGLYGFLKKREGYPPNS